MCDLSVCCVAGSVANADPVRSSEMFSTKAAATAAVTILEKFAFNPGLNLALVICLAALPRDESAFALPKNALNGVLLYIFFPRSGARYVRRLIQLAALHNHFQVVPVLRYADIFCRIAVKDFCVRN